MMKKSGRLPYSENGTLTFEENFICDTTPLQETKTSYNLIEEIYTTNEAIYIYNSAASALILPYRFIENQAVFNSLVDFLQAKTGKIIINITE
ncbi:MAG: YcxB family protein [Lachnospiraceae bacterium]|nr:YcxB family protein [Lachnospiraceae bacterium]